MADRYKMVNGERIKLTAEENAQRDKEEADWKAGAYDRAMVSLREKRNNLLKETDYYALSDVEMSDGMKKYRQDLRDITDGVNTEAKAKNKKFPTKPE
tara:strand:+ start:559 stop:852 length:294 start_codon:yes stop_codon:yes gene_type:complete